jgi:hypothetical protein
LWASATPALNDSAGELTSTVADVMEVDALSKRATATDRLSSTS